MSRATDHLPEPVSSLVDTHAHLDLLASEGVPVDVALERARQAGVRKIITVGIDLETSREAVRLADTNPDVYAAVGVHPHNSEQYDTHTERALRELASHPRVVAIGEIGLDYFRDRSPRERQRAAFRHQLGMAIDLGLTVCVHSREASQDVLRILSRDSIRPKATVMHCFNGDQALAVKMIELGCHLSLAGPVTFTNASRTAQAAAAVPLEALLLETDCPYLAPHPHRGETNEPALLPLIAGHIAELRGISIEEVARATTGNAQRVFGLD